MIETRQSDSRVSSTRSLRVNSRIHSALPLSLIRKMKLHTVLLNIGSNDLANERPPLNVAVDLMETESKLVDHYSVKHVIIMQIMNRVTANPNISTERTAYCNTILRTMCEVEQHIHFTNLKGYSQDAAIWTIDGIHPIQKKITNDVRRTLIWHYRIHAE